jgi:hypothetical protein
MSDSTTLRRTDVDNLAGKLEAFAQDLPEQEQNVLGWILHRAQATAGAELSEAELETVAGGQSSPLSTQLADSLGLDANDSIEGDSEITVAWKYSFGAQ